jgi:hypothetical protein
MVSLQQARATGRTNPDGWIEIRDQNGRLWCEYHPDRQTIRHYRKCDGVPTYAEIPIDSLIAGEPAVTLSTR